MLMPDISSPGVLWPGLLGISAFVLFMVSLKQPRLSFGRNTTTFLALNAFTLGCCIAADYHLSDYLPEDLLKHSPLVFTFLYLVIGGVCKKPLVWGTALFIPGLWFCCQYLDTLYFNVSLYRASLPQEPALLLLLALSLFALMHLAKTQKFWDALEQPELTAAFCYAMAGLFVLAIGAPSVFGRFGLPVYVWGGGLGLLALFGIWVSRLMADRALWLCCGVGILGSLYALGRYFFSD